MSKIISKPFEAAKKIVRSIFLGTPNLFTTSDLNRQIEAFKYQLDQLDDKTGVLSDISFEPLLTESSLNVDFKYSYIQVKACEFSPAITKLTGTFSEDVAKLFACLVADSETLTYDTDSTHEIAGAKFSDGTSMAAANQMIYKNEKIILAANPLQVNNLVGVLAKFEKIGTNITCKTNTIQRGNSLAMNSGEGGSNIPEIDWVAMRVNSSYSFNCKCTLKKGCLVVSTDRLQVSSLKVPPSAASPVILDVAYFPDDVKDVLLNYINNLSIPIYKWMGTAGTYFEPLQMLTRASGFDSSGTLKGFVELGIFAVFSDDTNNFKDIFIGLQFSTFNGTQGTANPSSWEGGRFFFSEKVTIMPLVG